MKGCMTRECAYSYSFQSIGSLLWKNSCWCLSIAFDSANNNKELYVHVQIRGLLRDTTESFYVLSVRMKKLHTDLKIFYKARKLFLTIMGKKREEKVIEIETDRANSMMKKISGAATRLERIMLGGVYQLWCGAHQLEFAVRNAYEFIVKKFQEPLYDLISCSKQPVNLKADMRTVCPKMYGTR